jgi:hypothetical protein
MIETMKELQVYKGEGCRRWHLMEHIHNNLMKLGGSLGIGFFNFCGMLTSNSYFH